MLIRRKRWAWDYPPPDAAIRGRTITADGWLGDWPADAELVLLARDRVLCTSTVRYARPDVAAALRLADDQVGFHLAGRIPAGSAGERLPVAVGVARTGEAPRILGVRNVTLVDADELPYEAAFRHAEERGWALRREEVYASGPPATEASPLMLAITRRYASGRILDFGCGAGPYTEAHRALGHVVHGLEFNPETARLARQRGVSVVRADGRRLPFADDAFDSVIAVEVLEHIAEPEAAVRECARVARRNLVVSVPNAAVIPHLFPVGVVPWHLLEKSHVNFFSAGTLEQLLRRAFPYVVVGYYARAFVFAETPPVHAHLFGVGSREPMAPGRAGPTE